MRFSNCASRRRRKLFALAISACPLLVCSTVRADRYWKNGITADTWSSGSDWSASSAAGTDIVGPPGSADNAYITNTDTLNEVVTLDENDTILSLQIGNNGGGSDTLAQTDPFNLSMVAEQVGIGTNSVGVHTQSAGTNTYSGGLIVGSGTSSFGTYNLSGTGSIDLTGTSTGTLGMYVGYNGSGTFNQTGGTVTLQGSAKNLYLGYSSTGVGSYLLSGGSLTVLGNEIIGYRGAGTLNQTGGTNTVGGTLYVGSGNSSNYFLSGGVLAAASEMIGSQIPGTINQSGGANTSSGVVEVGSSGHGGNYILSAGNFTANAGLNVGFSAAGTLNQSGGVLGVYGRDEEIGYQNAATFNQSGGVQTIGTSIAPANLDLGSYGGGAGTYNLSGTASLTVNGNVNIDGLVANSGGGYGTLNIGGGSVNVTGVVSLYGNIYATLNQTAGSLSAAGINLAGGSLACTSLSVGTVSPGSGINTGTFSQNTGTLTVTNGINLAGGTLALSSWGTFGSLSISGGVGTLDSVNVGGVTGSGQAPAISMQSFQMSGGTVSSNQLTIGEYGPGSYTQSGGAHTTGDLILASRPDGLSTAQFSSGSLTAASIYMGELGTGSCTLGISGGSVITPFWLTVISGGVVNLSAGNLSVGTLLTTGAGNWLNWTGGTLNLTGSSLTIGSGGQIGSSLTLGSGQTLQVTPTLNPNLSVTGSLTLSGGAAACSSISIAGGIVNQTSGAVIAGTLGQNGAPNASTGTLAIQGNYNLSGGSVTAYQLISGGNYGSGTLSVSGSGSVSAANGIMIGSSGGTGSVNISNGGLVASQNTTLIGGSNILGYLTLGAAGKIDAGASLYSANSIYIGASYSGGGTATVYPGTTLGTAGVINLNPDGAINLAGGTIQAQILDTRYSANGLKWTSGTLNVSGSIVNATTLSIPSGGTLVGSATVAGAVSTAAGGIVRPSLTTPTAPRVLTFDDLTPPSGGTAINNEYAGLNWSNFFVANASSEGIGYVASTVSKPNVAYNGYGNPATLSSAVPFTLIGLNLGAAWNDGLAVTIDAFNGTTLADATTVYPLATSTTLYTLNYAGITSVTFSAAGGTSHPGYTQNGTQFVLDNLQITTTGSGTAIQTFAAGLDLSAGGTYDWQPSASLKDNSTGAAGVDFAQVQVTGGNLSLGGASKFNVNFSQIAPGNIPGGANKNTFWNASHIWSVATVSGTGTNSGATNFTNITNGSYSTGGFATQLNPDGKSVDLVYNELNLSAGSATNAVLGAIALSGSNGNYALATMSGGNATHGSIDISGLNPGNDSPVMVQMDVTGSTAAINQWYAELSGMQTGGPTGYTIVPAGAANPVVPAGDTGFVLSFANIAGSGDRFINFDWDAGNDSVTLDEVQIPAPEPSSSLLIAMAAPALLMRQRNSRLTVGE